MDRSGLHRLGRLTVPDQRARLGRIGRDYPGSHGSRIRSSELEGVDAGCPEQRGNRVEHLARHIGARRKLDRSPPPSTLEGPEADDLPARERDLELVHQVTVEGQEDRARPVREQLPQDLAESNSRPRARHHQDRTASASDRRKLFRGPDRLDHDASPAERFPELRDGPALIALDGQNPEPPGTVLRHHRSTPYTLLIQY